MGFFKVCRRGRRALSSFIVFKPCYSSRLYEDLCSSWIGAFFFLLYSLIRCIHYNNLKHISSIYLPASANMNKGGGGLGGGAGGPTAAAAAAAAQKQKTLLQRVDTDIGNLVDNFGYIVNVTRVNDPPVRNSQESFMMEMRAARMVQAADSLLKLVSELKQTAIFSGFASLDDHVEQRTQEFNNLTENTNGILSRIGEEVAASLKELECHYYSSSLRTSTVSANEPSE